MYAVVAQAERGRGIGSALYERSVSHLLERGATELRSWSFADGEAFLERRGFTRTRQERVSAVDPRTADTSALDSLPDGVSVVPLAGLHDRLPELYEVYRESSADAPSDHAETRLSYEEWLSETIGKPELSHDGSFVVLVDDRPAALSWLGVDETRRFAEQELTGTLRAYRRRGLARLAKLAVLRWAAANGYTRITTGNDETNVGMLAINTELGFRPFAVETEWVKHVT